jgi:radical SAM-linked protein
VSAVVQHIRIRYTRRGRLRFASHRDVARVFERAVRRAGVPIAFSEGFSPHPRLSYAGAAPTGTASEAEYLEIGLASDCDPSELATRLDAALPDGIDIIDAVTKVPGGTSLGERITGSRWRIELPGLAPEAVRAAIDAFLAASEAPVERAMKDGTRIVDARAAVASITVEGTDCAILEMDVRHVTPAVRPDDVLAALRGIADLAPPSPPKVTRLAQGLLADDGRLTDPLENDRAEVVTDPA